MILFTRAARSRFKESSKLKQNLTEMKLTTYQKKKSFDNNLYHTRALYKEIRSIV
jgi:hypothetical protein